ncbi:TetR/AcrR family transcriptional regulator [Nocardia jejuensis]|uniref:TetR/AcrR family transcriptional regulator n=1 Tax=Nocardia jejuensis TaxID=328049 RepID=UPI000836AE50|nr:TetR/AcrR family transcriptional regulator [Nocardia jejuensis]
MTKRRYAKRLAPADRREQLLDAALAIVSESGFSAVSIAAVAERSDVTRPVVYDLFGSRDEVLEELIERESARMHAAVERATADAWARGTVDDSSRGTVDDSSRDSAVDSSRDTAADSSRGSTAAASQGVTAAASQGTAAAAVTASIGQFLIEVRAMPATWRLVYFPIDGVPPALRDRVEKARDELRTPLRRMLGEWLSEHPDDAAGVDLDVLVQLAQGIIQTAARLVLDDPEHYDPDRVLRVIGPLLFA